MISFVRFGLLLAVIAISVAQAQNADPESCAITRPASKPLTPASPYPAKFPEPGKSWYGTSKLWVALDDNGTTYQWPHNKKVFRTRVLWWREGYDAHATPEPPFSVRAQRMDNPSAAFRMTERAHGELREQDYKSFISAPINFPTPGCWAITGKYDHDELTFVVWIAP